MSEENTLVEFFSDDLKSIVCLLANSLKSKVSLPEPSVIVKAVLLIHVDISLKI